MKCIIKSMLFYFSILLVFYYNYIIIIHHIINNSCISLIIPSTYKDINRCNKTLIRSICNLKEYPTEIVIVISGVVDRFYFDLSILRSELIKCTKILRILTRKKDYNAASNRNYGYSHSSCSIISFFDVDDVMSIYRINIINRIFMENKNIDIVFHPSTRNFSILNSYNMSEIYSQNVVVKKYKEITKKCRDTFSYKNMIHKCDVSNGFYITNGWPSIKRYIMNYIKFNESLYGTEDLDFISRVVVKGFKVALFKMPLGFYIKDFNCII